MEAISDLELFQKCRLCGVIGLHQLDILKCGWFRRPNGPNALSEKIFRCVGIRVERNDKLTTKICGNCYDRINEIVIFRKICAATNILLTNALTKDQEPFLDPVVEISNGSIKISPFNDEGVATTIGAMPEMDSTDTETTSRSALVVNDFDEAAIDIDGCNANSNDANLAMDTSPSPCTKEAKQPLNSGYEVFERDSSNNGRVNQKSSKFRADNDRASSGNVPHKLKTSRSKVTSRHRICKVKCGAPNRGSCKESYDSYDAMMHHVKHYHAKGIKKTFECHLCQKSLSRKVSIQGHIKLVHTGLKSFECPNQSCSRGFFRESNLKEHIDSVHRRLKPFKCSNTPCSRKFYLRRDLNRHIDSVHRDLRPFMCSNQSQSKMFARKANLEQHEHNI